MEKREYGGDFSSMTGKISRRQLLLAMGALSAGGLAWAVSDDIEEAFAAHATEPKENGLVPLIYSKGYNIGAFGLEKLHPFDSRKYEKIYKNIRKAGLRDEEDFLRPSGMTEEQLLKIHTKRYLKSLSDSFELSKILEVAPTMFLPAFLTDWRILKPMRLAAGGTLLTCRAALKHGVAINLGGGYHHAFADRGGGFCVYSDIPVSIKILQEEGLVKHVLIVDTDAHQGNGFATLARGSNGLFSILDFYDESIYPHPKVEEDWSVPFAKNTDGKTYLSTLEETLPKAISKFQPELIVYNAGSDVLESDPLSSLTVSPKEMNKRDLFVVSCARSQNIPVAMVLAGGYSKESAVAHADSIKEIINKFDDRS